MTLRFSVPKGGRRTSHGHIPQGLDRRQVPGDEHEPRVRRARRLHHRKLLEARRMRPSRQGGKGCSCLPSFPNYLFGGNEAFSNSDEWTQYCRLRFQIRSLFSFLENASHFAEDIVGRALNLKAAPVTIYHLQEKEKRKTQKQEDVHVPNKCAKVPQLGHVG